MLCITVVILMVAAVVEHSVVSSRSDGRPNSQG
jgi:hypothetical protein